MADKAVTIVDEDGSLDIEITITSETTRSEMMEFVKESFSKLSDFKLRRSDGVFITSDADMQILKDGERIHVCHSVSTPVRPRVGPSRTKTHVSKRPSSVASSTDEEGNVSNIVSTPVTFEPDGSVLFESAAWTYYQSEDSRLPICISFSELIDNSLSATVTNPQVGLSRDISLRYYHDDLKETDSVFMVADNGIGMTVETLTNWATYKFAKDKRRDRELAIAESATLGREKANRTSSEKGTRASSEKGTRASSEKANRASSSSKGAEMRGFLNSNLSKFGAGGKEAAFFVGRTVMMMTKFRGSDRVNYIELSEKEFSMKKAKGESVYAGEIKTRDPGDSTGIHNRIIRWIIENEEIGKDSFTHCIITTIKTDSEIGDRPENRIKSLLKTDYFHLSSRLLSDVYHYYLHGPSGNFTDDIKTKRMLMEPVNRSINIHFKLYRIPKVHSINDHTVFIIPYKERNLAHDDPDYPSSRTLLIRNFHHTKLMFRGQVDLTNSYTSTLTKTAVKKFEGVIYYYPYEYDRETFPLTDYNCDIPDYDPAIKGRGTSHIFDCYWNGRFIPNSKFEGFWFMHYDKNRKGPPEECYNRIAGVIFFSDEWKVTQNKQTFASSLKEALDIKQLTGVKANYSQITLEVYEGNKWTKRNIESVFREWLQECHEKYDKKIIFSDFQGLESRSELPKVNQYPWSKFKTIEWDRKKLTVDDLVKTVNTKPICAGKVIHFWAKGDYTNDVKGRCVSGSREKSPGQVCGYGGEVVIRTDPSREVRTFPLSCIDRKAEKASILALINSENDKMPCIMEVAFPDWESVIASPIQDGDSIQIGQMIGPFQVDVLNKRNTSLQGKVPGMRKLINIQLTVYLHESLGQIKHISSLTSNVYSKHYKYWFEKISPWKTPGKYRIHITSSLGPGPKSTLVGPTDSDNESQEGNGGCLSLPEYSVTFTVIPGDPENLSTSFDKPIRIQVPFDLPIIFEDKYHNTIHNTPNPDDYEIRLLSKSGTFELNQVKVKEVKRGEDIPGLLARFTLLNTTDKFKWTKGEKEMVKTVKAQLEVKSKKTTFPILKLDFAAKVGRPDRILVFPDKQEGDIIIENGTLPSLGIKVLDACHNLVTCDIEPKLQGGIMVEFFHEERKLSTHTLDFNTGPDGSIMNLKGGAVLKFNLGKDLMKHITARVYLKDFKNVKLIERKVVVKPSCKPASMRLFYRSDVDSLKSKGSDVDSSKSKGSDMVISELRHREEVEWTAGEMMRDITFQLFDESGKVIQKPSLRGQDMKISWKHCEWVESTGWKVSMLKEGKLPDVRSPREAGSTLNCSVTFFTSDKGASKDDFTFEFKVTSIPGDPTSIHLSVDDGRTATRTNILKLSAGQQMDIMSSIVVQILDKFANGCNKVTEDDIDQLKVFCKTGTMVKGSLKKVKGDADGEIHVSKIKFTDCTKLGSHALEFVYHDLKAVMSVELIHGIPARLVWFIDPPTNDSTGTIPIMKDSKMQVRFQLVDSFNNLCYQEGIKVQIGTSPKLFFKDHNDRPLTKHAITGNNGIADFGTFTVSIKEGEDPAPCKEINRCLGKCYGLLIVQARAVVEVSETQRIDILSEKCSLHVKCDNTIPTGFHILCDGMDHENKSLRHNVTAGDKLPYFKVHLFAEDGTILLSLHPNSIFMQTMMIGRLDTMASLIPTEFNQEHGQYSFDYNTPVMCGDYLLKFTHIQPGTTLPIYSDPISFKVIPSHPFAFKPLDLFPEPWVSNTNDPSARLILSNLTFFLLDRHNNPIPTQSTPPESSSTPPETIQDDKYAGTLTAQIIGMNNEPSHTLPKFHGLVGSLSFPIAFGQCTIPTLQLAENSPGEDGSRYKIVFTPKFDIPIMVKTSTIEPFVPRQSDPAGDSNPADGKSSSAENPPPEFSQADGDSVQADGDSTPADVPPAESTSAEPVPADAPARRSRTVMKEEPLRNYEMCFGFVNDVVKQAKMRKLTVRRSEIKKKMRNINSIQDQIAREEKDHMDRFNQIDASFKHVLNRNREVIDVTITEESDPDMIRGLIREKSHELESIREEGSSRCTLFPRFLIAPAPNEPNVLGKIIHLVKVESIQASRLLSWHIRSDLNCIVTSNTAKARELDKRFNGNQQVWPIDNINRRFHSFRQDTVPLPHTQCHSFRQDSNSHSSRQDSNSHPSRQDSNSHSSRQDSNCHSSRQDTNCRQSWEVTGNPRWALSLVSFEPKTESAARIVFNCILNNVLVMDTIDDALKYRYNCDREGVDTGTILTLKDGRRLAASGKFGGSGNSAPPLTDSSYKRFGMFHLTPGRQEEALQSEINLLNDLQEKAETRREMYQTLFHFRQSKAPDILNMKLDQARYFKEIDAIDRDIASFSKPPDSHSILRINGGNKRTSDGNYEAAPSKRSCS